MPQARHWTIRHVPVCSSTEELLGTWLRDQPSLLGPRAVIATHQRRGVGQRGRSWVSPPGGVWISAALPWRSHGSGQAGLLGLALALSVAQRLEQRGLSVQIKWPNDLLVNGRKLAGLLPGVVQRGSQLRLLRIGLGLNVRNSVPGNAIALRRLEGQQDCGSDPVDGGGFTCLRSLSRRWRRWGLVPRWCSGPALVRSARPS